MNVEFVEARASMTEHFLRIDRRLAFSQGHPGVKSTSGALDHTRAMNGDIFYLLAQDGKITS